MKDETRQILNMLDDLFSDHRPAKIETAREVWDVLAALRGPDRDDGEANLTLKDAMTVPIRQAAFPKTTEAAKGKWQRERLSYDRPLAGAAMFAPMTSRNLGGGKFCDRIAEWKRNAGYHHEKDAHFLGHIRSAARILGLF